MNLKVRIKRKHEKTLMTENAFIRTASVKFLGENNCTIGWFLISQVNILKDSLVMLLVIFR